MTQNELIYWYGISATAYVVTCWMFAVIRWFHTCCAPKESCSSLWPDRKLQVAFFCMGTVLVPYIYNPASETAWNLWKSYFPGTYYFYSGALLFCFFGSVRQWNRWRTDTWIAGMLTIIIMAPLVIDAWLPGGLMKPSSIRIWNIVVAVVSVGMMGYCGLAMWQVGHWMREVQDDYFSNPDDYPYDYARRVWLMPVILTPLLWTGYILDSQKVMAVLNLLLAIFNVVLLIIAMPPWRRTVFALDVKSADQDEEEEDSWHDEQAEERARKIAGEIEAFVREGRGYLDPHLKIDHVVEHCSYSRTYVSHVFKTRFGGFSRYVNRLRLEHYDRYLQQHPGVTKDTAAQESGFSSYTAYYKVKDRLRE